MRIGILTFHRACNYGAVLQCYALQQFLVSEGHDVEVVDYRQRDVERVYAVFRPWHWIKQVLRCRKYAFVYLYRIPQRIRAKVSFGLFLSKYLKLSKPCTLADMPQGYDLYVIGSDQLWNQHITWGIDQVYWGNFDAGNAKLITYAVSSSMKCFEKIDHRYIKESIKRFSAISCREKCLCDYLNASVEGASAV